MKQINYGPDEAKGREFYESEDSLWVLVTMGPKEFYGKIASMEVFKQAAEGAPFALHHPYVLAKEGALYLPAISRTMDPWFIINCDTISMVHYKIGMEFDKKTKELFSPIVVATSMPKLPETPFKMV